MGQHRRPEPIGAFNGFKRGGKHVHRGAKQDQQEYMYAGLGTVTLIAGGGNDTLKGGPGNDTLIGGSGNTKLFGGPGRDTLIGGRGNNLIVDGQGPATIDTGAGINVVDVRGHRGHDTITCPGSKRNTILAKPGDTIASNCRGVIRRFGARSVHPQRATPALAMLL